MSDYHRETRVIANFSLKLPFSKFLSPQQLHSKKGNFDTDLLLFLKDKKTDGILDP